MLVLEDLHWADESTLDLVAFLVNAAAVQRLLFLPTYRSDEVRADDPLQRLAAGLVGTARRCRWRSSRCRRRRCGRCSSPAASCAGRGRRGDRRARGGQPVLRRRAARGRGAGRDRALAGAARRAPGQGRAARRARRARYCAWPPPRGATSPTRCWPRCCRSASWSWPRRCAPRSSTACSSPITTTGSFRFRHALIAEAVCGTLLPGERELVHERLARALSEAPRLAAGGAAEEAHHWVAAGRPVEALEASLRAAREAEAVSGLSEALRHVERVLELWESVPQAEELAGLALPSVLDWAAALVGSSSEESPRARGRGGAAAVPVGRRAREPRGARLAAVRGRGDRRAAAGEHGAARRPRATRRRRPRPTTSSTIC